MSLALRILEWRDDARDGWLGSLTFILNPGELWKDFQKTSKCYVELKKKN